MKSLGENKTFTVVDYRDLEQAIVDYCQPVEHVRRFNTNIVADQNWRNDSYQTLDLTDKYNDAFNEDTLAWYMEQIQKWHEDQEVEGVLGMILEIMAKERVIEPKEYLVDVSW